MPHATRLAIRTAAAERNRLHAALRAGEPGAAEAYPRTREFLDRLTAPEARAALARHEPDALDYALAFLEEYPRCPDSGFAVRDLCRALRDAPAPLPGAAAARLRAALLAIVAQPLRDEFKHLRRLARTVADESFIADLDTLALTAPEDAPAHANARALADYLAKADDA